LTPIDDKNDFEPIRVAKMGFVPFIQKTCKSRIFIFKKNMDFLFLLECRPNGPIYFGQAFSGLDKPVIKLKIHAKITHFFIMLNHAKWFFCFVFMLNMVLKNAKLCTRKKFFYATYF